MSKLNVSCCNVIYFSCPTCSSEGKCLFPPSLQLPLTNLKTCLPHHLETSPVFHPVIPLIAFLWLSPAAPHFPWITVPIAGNHVPRKAFYYHMRKKDHVMHLTDYIPVHTFHNSICFFFRNRMLLNHVQLVTGYNPKRTFLYNCYPSSLPVPSCICSADRCFCWSVQIAFVKSIAGFAESHSNSFEFIKFIWNWNCLLLGQ